MIILFLVGVGLLVYFLSQGEGITMTGEQNGQRSPVYDLSTLQAMAMSHAEVVGLDPALVFAIIKQESNWNPNAVNPSDPSYGLMQLNANYFGIVLDPDENLTKGCALLFSLINRYDLNTAIQMYNAGEQGYLNGVRVPAYLSSVLNWYSYYKAQGV